MNLHPKQEYRHIDPFAYGFQMYYNAVFPVAYTSAWSTSCIEMMTVSNKMKEIAKNEMQVMCIIVGFKRNFFILKVFSMYI